MAPQDKLYLLAGNHDRKLVVGTHDGKFHLDEVACIALIRKYYRGDMEIIRTRDEEKLEECSIIVDVGGKTEITANQVRFDHQHTIAGVKDDNSEYYENGVMYSSIGKLAKWLYEDEYNKPWLDFLLKEFLYSVQACDNGQDYEALGLNPPIFNLTPYMNPTVIEGDSEEEQMRLFKQVVGMVTILIDRLFAKYNVDRNTLFMFENDLTKYDGSGIVILTSAPDFNQVVQYNNVVEPEKQIKLAVYPDFKYAKYRVHVIPKEVNNGDPIILFPKKWRGLKAGDLDAVTKIEKGYGVGANGCYASWRTLESAIKGAQKALALGETE